MLPRKSNAQQQFASNNGGQAREDASKEMGSGAKQTGVLYILE